MAISGLQLVVQQGPRTGQTFELDKPVITIGREASNDIVLEDPQLSRHHARLMLQGAGYVVEDLGSTNGTLVNGQRVTAPKPISGGDLVALGDNVVLRVMGTLGAGETVVARGTQPQTVAVSGPLTSPAAFAPQPPPPVSSYSPPPQPPAYGAPAYGAPAYGAPPSSPQKSGPSCWVWGCGCLVILVILVVVIGILGYLLAPPDIAGPVCQALRGVPVLGGLCP